jgi:flagellar export protein FliJ
MRFAFSLATVLRVRQIAEEREERLLTQILAQIATTRRELNELQEQVTLLIERSQREMQSSIAAAQLQITYGHWRALETMQKDVAEQLSKLEELRDLQMSKYGEARRNREVLTQLREDQMDRFRYEVARREQSLMDDNFSSRRLAQ